MSASTAPSPSGAEPTPRAVSLTDWLRRRTDLQLIQLIRLRPDLGLPAAADIGALAGRLGVRTSAQRAVDALDASALRTLENLVLAAGPDDFVADEALEGAAPDRHSLEPLFERALVWGDPDLVHLTPTVRDAVGVYPAGLGRPASALFTIASDSAITAVQQHLGVDSPHRARAEAAARIADPVRLADDLADLDEDERNVLERLATGPPVGTVRDTRTLAGESGRTPAHRLLERGLLVAIDHQRVELPREIGLALRHGPAAPSSTPPPMRLAEREPAELDRVGTTAVLEALRLVDLLADSWSAQPPAMLRSGGLGVRDLKRTAKDLDADEVSAALIAETVFAAGLVNATSGPAPVFLPSADYDAWRARDTAQRWSVVASAWLSMTRQPSLVSQRGERDRVIAALSPDAERGTIPALRRQVLDLLGGARPGAAPADRSEVLSLFAWYQPRRASALLPLVEAILDEADLLGVTAAGGITGYTRTLLAGTTQAAERALDQALPEPVDHFLVQPDLTVVVPGPPTPDLGLELGLVADLESTGGASVYRITERSVRRALDAGRSASALRGFVTAHSRTPVPQALEYLIDDAARRHGILRAGNASAYLRCDDEALLARVAIDRSIAGLNLRLIAPTVAICDVPIMRLLDALREGGFAPAAESPEGELVTLDAEPRRAPSRPIGRIMSTRGLAGDDKQLAEVVRRLRSGDALAGGDSRVQSIAREIPGVTSAATMELLRNAVRSADLIWFGCAETDGTTTAHTMQPISLAAGVLRGYERGRSGLSAYPVHRITALRVLDDGESADRAES